MGVTRAQLESAARGNLADLRLVLLGMHDQLTQVSLATGTSAAQPSSNSSTALTRPGTPGIAASGANGSFAITITPPSVAVPATIFYEVSYCEQQAFTSGVTVMPATAATNVTLDMPGATYFFRVRASFDQKTWSAYQATPTSTAAGLQTTSAISPNIPLNQSNYAVLDSIAQNGTVFVRVYGVTGGVGTPWVNTQGKVFPAASIVGTMPGADASVAYDPVASMYRVKYRIGDVFPDDWVIVGNVSVVTLDPPKLPKITPIIQSGAVVAYNVTDGGSGITAPLTLTIVDSAGSGATAGDQTIKGGVLKSVAPGNAGKDYSTGATVVASGGQASVSEPGGGGATGGNGGRLTAL